MVTEAVPELMSKREGRLLSLGLRARVSAWTNKIKVILVHLITQLSAVEKRKGNSATIL